MVSRKIRIAFWVVPALLAGAVVIAQTATAPLVTQVSKTPKAFATAKAADAGATGGAAAVVDKTNNRVTFSGNEVHITADSGPESNMMSFAILGLSNPEIRVHAGAQVTLTVVNVDDDMNHSLALSRKGPPYADDLTLPADTITTGSLKSHEKESAPLNAAVLVVKAGAAGQGYYICTIHGHAAKGMYGKFTVLP